MQFVRNAWYVAGWASEFDRTLRRFTILGDDIVMYRGEDGEVCALRDRCPHRQLADSAQTKSRQNDRPL